MLQKHTLLSMSILEKVTSDMKDAMKAKDKLALTVIRALKSAITNAEKSSSKEISEADVIGIIRKQVKQRQDSITQYRDAGRLELAEIEGAEITILEKYLPQPLSEAEIVAVVNQVIFELGASGLADMGKVIQGVQAKCEGRADGKTLSLAVKSALSSL
jgi:uncharacterized protein